MDDPVLKNQSKHVGSDGKLRYDADGSEVFPGPSGVRRWPTPEAIAAAEKSGCDQA